jgi:hypothetical protein
VHHFFDRPGIFHWFLTIKVEIRGRPWTGKHSMTTFAPAVAQARERGAADAAVFDAVEFSALSEMIGEDGVREMVEIFATETRQRLQRLTVGGQT